MKTIVTGGAGFIGSNLVERLIDLNHDVIVLDNFSTGRLGNLESLKDKIQIIDCDLSKIETNWTNAFNNIDWVFHLAALADIVPSIKNPRNYYSSNVIATFNLLETIRMHKVKKLLYAASASCYGIAKVMPTNEKANISLEYPYAFTKYIAETNIMHWSKIYKIPSISLRLFNVYGPKSRTSGTYGAVLGVFLAQKLASQPFTVVGDGNQSRDFTYVSDVVEAFICAANSNKTTEIYNVGSDSHTSINKLVELLKGEKVYIPKRPGEPEITFADISKIKKDLNWQPKIKIEEGIKKVLTYIDYWRNAPIWTPDDINEATKDWFKYLK